MMTLRRSRERGHTRLDWLDSYHTFSFDTYFDERFVNFGVLRVINEDRVEPGMGFRPHSHRDMDIVTIVLEGNLAHEDSLGNGSVIKPGEVQRMTAGTGITHSEFNHSKADPVHFLQIWIIPASEGLDPGYEQKEFPLQPAQNQWQLIVSQDGQDNSVQVHQDMKIYRAFLDSGSSLSFPVHQDRQVWLHLVCGELTLNGSTLSDGDSAGFIEPGDLDLHAAKAAELYLFEMPRMDETILGDDV